MSRNECQHYYHTAECKQATELAQFPHDLNDNGKCKNCYGTSEYSLDRPCSEHPEQTPTLMFSHPTCTGCWEETFHNGEGFGCSTCDVYWPHNAHEETRAERNGPAKVAYSCGAVQ